MLQAIKTLGEYEIKSQNLDDIEVFIEKAKLNNIKKVLCIIFKKYKENVFYDHISIEDYDSLNPQKYLYRSHQSRQFDITPTTKIAYDSRNKRVEIEKAFNRIKYWFKKFLPIVIKKNQREFLNKLNDVISRSEKNILNELSKKSDTLKSNKNPKEDEKRNSIVTIKIHEDEKDKHVGNFEIFRNLLQEEGLRACYHRHGVEIKGEGMCNLCGNKKEVCDYFPLKIYSMDKKGFAPDFIQKNAWKRLPVCFDCLPYLMQGNEFLNRYLRKKFYHGYNFYVIPKFITGEIDERLIKEIKRGEKKAKYEGLLIEDDYILEPLKEKSKVLTLIFMFCEFGQSIKVVKYVEDVPPSWIKEMENLLKEIRTLPIFKEDMLKMMGVIGKKKTGDLKNIEDTTVGGLVQTFFPRSKQTGIYSKYFIDIIGDILAQRPINKSLLIKAFMREIRNRHINNKTWEEKVLVLKSLMLLLFLQRSNLLKSH